MLDLFSSKPANREKTWVSVTWDRTKEEEGEQFIYWVGLIEGSAPSLLAWLGPTFRKYLFSCSAISTGLVKVLLLYTTLLGYDWPLVYL